MAETRHLRVLIANEKRERLELLAQVVAGLGHEVVAREIYMKEVGAVLPLRRLNHRRRGSARGARSDPAKDAPWVEDAGAAG